MERAEHSEATGTIADYLIRKLKDEKHGLENAVAYLRSTFLSSAVDALFYARHKAGLTQEQVAQRLGKKQEAIARWEADKDGRMSLRQYFDLAVASGKIPLNIVLEPVEAVRDFVIDLPEEPPTPYHYYEWLRKKAEPALIAQTTTVQTFIQPVAVSTPLTSVPTPNQEAMPTAKAVEQYLGKQREQSQNQVINTFSQWSGESATNTTSRQPLVLDQPLA
jgi:transcriptional regulator with XRE-family HTH domain